MRETLSELHLSVEFYLSNIIAFEIFLIVYFRMFLIRNVPLLKKNCILKYKKSYISSLLPFVNWIN